VLNGAGEAGWITYAQGGAKNGKIKDLKERKEMTLIRAVLGGVELVYSTYW